MQSDVFLLILRFGFAALLYLFILVIGVVVYRDFRRAGTSSTERHYSDSRWKLVVLNPGETNLIEGKSYELEPVTSIGRNPSNSIMIPDSFASGAHALIAWHDQQWWLEDLNSTNGTLLNRKQVKKPTPVSPGDIVQIGQVNLKLVR